LAEDSSIWYCMVPKFGLLGPRFYPHRYFDGSYDLFRNLKYEAIKEEASGDVFAGWLASLGFSLLSDGIVFQASLDGPFKAAPDTGGTINDYPHLRECLPWLRGSLQASPLMPSTKNITSLP